MAVQIHYEIAAMIFMLAATLVFSHQRHLRVYRSSLFSGLCCWELRLLFVMSFAES